MFSKCSKYRTLFACKKRIDKQRRAKSETVFVNSLFVAALDMYGWFVFNSGFVI